MKMLNPLERPDLESKDWA